MWNVSLGIVILTMPELQFLVFNGILSSNGECVPSFLKAKIDLERQVNKYASEKERLRDQVAATKVKFLGFQIAW